jgi:hypothetical protein
MTETKRQTQEAQQDARKASDPERKTDPPLLGFGERNFEFLQHSH